MTLELTCFNISSSLPSIPTNNTLANIPVHSHYNPNGRAIAQLISSSLARSTFSTDDIRSFLNQITSENMKSWDVSTIVKLKPMTSTIIYLSITLALFIVLSLVFCIISCNNCCKREVTDHRRKRRKCTGRCFCVVLILLIVFLLVGEMIYISYVINRTKVSLDDSIKEMNEEIYPKEISIYFEHLLQQFKQLDQYSTQTDSILIKASHSIFVKIFDEIFREKYFFDEIRRSAMNSSAHITELNELIHREIDLLNGTIDLFQNIQDDNKRMFDDLEKPLQELCDYANGTDIDIDKTMIESLSQIHEQLIKLIDTIQNDFLNHIPFGENAMLIDKNLEDQIRWYIHLVGIILLVLVITIGLIPMTFFIFIILCRLCHCQQHDTDSKYGLVHRHSKPKSKSNVVLCCMRIFFIPMIIILMIIVLVSGVLYGVDLFTQGACRTAHNDQSFLLTFLIDELIGTNSSNLIIAGSDVGTTVTNIIDDCGNQIHFIARFLENYLDHLDNYTKNAMNQLNEKIFETFNNSIDDINVTSTLDRLIQLSNVTNSTDIQEKIQQTQDDLTTIQTRFDNIMDSIPTLPINLVNQTIDDFRSYLNSVLESSVDQCPLPLATIYKADTLICHDLATSINGLWLNLFVYMFLITFGLCICGLCIYKRSQSLSSNRSFQDNRF